MRPSLFSAFHGSLSLSICLPLSLLACSTVPASMPPEYKTAQAAVDRANDKDVDDVFPQTVARAESELDAAADIYTKTQKKGVSEDQRSALLQAGNKKAESARTLAEKAIELDAQVKSWDERIERKAEEEELARDLRILREKLAIMNERNRDESRLATAHIKGPLVFFKKGNTTVDAKFQHNLNKLAEALRENPTLQVTLIGHSDQSGSNDKNARLSELRANNVAKILRSQGVADDQIMIDAQGSSQAEADKDETMALMERRVDVFLVNRSSADIMMSGR